jgi:hypothetical protein
MDGGRPMAPQAVVLTGGWREQPWSAWAAQCDRVWGGQQGELWRVAAGLVVLCAAGATCSLMFQRGGTGLGDRARFVVGFGVSVNFVALWAAPIMLQGALFKVVLVPLGARRLYERLDASPALRAWAARWVYREARFADFFLTEALLLLWVAGNVSLAVWAQRAQGHLPWSSLWLYYLGWCGVGGRAMGGAYTMAHKEGHNLTLYREWIRGSVGNVFENWVGLLYGGVPHNFTTTHISLHHRLQAGRGDTFYCWDGPRGSWPDLCVYLARGLAHMSGWLGLAKFAASPRKVDRARNLPLLGRGVLAYWLALPLAASLALTPSWWFWIVLQPLLCMSFFLSLVNLGFHAFLGDDSVGGGEPCQCVDAVTLLGSDDDYFGEDDHMAHHYAPTVYHRDLAAHQARQVRHWARHHASVFQCADAFSFAMLVELKAWALLAELFVDYSGTLSKPQIALLLQERARRIELFDPASGKRSTRVVRDQHSGAYLALLQHLEALQLWIAAQLAKGLPPLQPDRAAAMVKLLQAGAAAAKVADGRDLDVGRSQF